jgi:hypothetical protein
VPAGPSVALAIDFGNGIRCEYAALPWFPGMTVGDALDAASAARPGLEFAAWGRESQAFLTSLGGIANEGREGRNWLYRIDGRPGEVSFRIAKLEAQARVLWIFTTGE